MDPALRAAWTHVVTGEDYEEHMAAVGQAQAAAALTVELIESAAPPEGGRVVVVGAGTGQMLDYLDVRVLRPFRLTFSDLNPAYLARLESRLLQHELKATLLQDDIESTALEPGADLLLATLVLEQIDWRRGVAVFAGLKPAACCIILQENPPEFTSSVTPGRRLPPSMARAVEFAHPQLVRCRDLVGAFATYGYELKSNWSREVVDGKRLIGVLFEPERAVS